MKPAAVLLLLLCSLPLAPSAVLAASEKVAPAAPTAKVADAPRLSCLDVEQPWAEEIQGKGSCDDVCAESGAACVATTEPSSWSLCSDPAVRRATQVNPATPIKNRCRCCRVGF